MRLLVTMVLLTVTSMNGCHLYGPAPGKGAKAEHFYVKAEPIIQALEAYLKSTGSYPETLEALKPIYLKEVDWPPRTYQRTEGGYELWFSYEGPEGVQYSVSANRPLQADVVIQAIREMDRQL